MRADAAPGSIWAARAAACAAVWALFLAAYPAETVAGADHYAEYAAIGERLIHGVAPSAGRVSFRLPAASAAAALASHHSPLPPLAMNAALLGLTAAATALLSAFWAPAALLVLPVVLLPLLASDNGGMFVEGFYGLSVTLAAATIVLRARRPSPRADAACAAALGATLLIRSPLVFFPPLLAAAALWEARREGRAAPLRALVTLGAAPYAALAPWIAMNWAVHGRFLPLELGAFNSNVVSGAAGLRETVEGSWQAFLGAGAFGEGSLLAAAVEEMLRHPWRSAAGFIERFALVLSLQPLLWAGAAAAAWAGRRRADVRHAALLCAYFALIHCLPAVERRYLAPIYPTLAALAAFGAAALLAGRQSRPSPAVERACAAGGGLLLAGLLAVCLYAGAKSVALAARPAEDRTWEAAVSAEPWLLAERGELLLSRGAAAEAASDFDRARRLDPGEPSYRLSHAWASFLSGEPRPVARLETPPAPSAGEPGWRRMRQARLRQKALLMKAGAHLAGGDAKAARADLSAYLSSCLDETLAREGGTERARRAVALMRAEPRDCLLRAHEALPWGGRGERLAFARELAGAAPRGPYLTLFHLELAARAQQESDFDLAWQALSWAENRVREGDAVVSAARMGHGWLRFAETAWDLRPRQALAALSRAQPAAVDGELAGRIKYAYAKLGGKKG